MTKQEVKVEREVGGGDKSKQMSAPQRKRRKGKRKNRTGTVYKVGDRFRWQVDVGQYTGTERNVIGGYEATEEAAELKAIQAIADFSRKYRALPRNTTLREQAETWLERHCTIEERTGEKYRRELNYALKYIGHLQISEVESRHIRDLIPLLVREKVKHGRPLAHVTVQRVLTRLRAVFREAISVDRVIYVDPMAGIKLRRPNHEKEYSEEDEDDEESVKKALNREQADRLIQIGSGLHKLGLCRLWPALFLGLSTGMRRSEIIGLKWKDIDFENLRLHIRRGRVADVKGVKTTWTKSKSSRRTIPLPPQAAQLLKNHREVQEEERRNSPLWNEQDVVFATSTGEWTHIDNLNRALRKVIAWSTPERLLNGSGKKQTWQGIPVEKRLPLQVMVQQGQKLPDITPHSLRHTYATLALRERGKTPGVTAELISKYLGHADPSITFKIYRHVLEDEERSGVVDLFPQLLDLS